MNKIYLVVIGVGIVTFCAIVFHASRLGDDDVVRERIVGVLMELSDIDVENLRITVAHGVATIEGEVPSEGHRCRVLELVENVEGVTRVVEIIEVISDDQTSGSNKKLEKQK